ncbi:MAG: thioredoxin [Geminicoccaceae bacterium]
MAVTQTSDTDFEKDVIKAGKPVVVDFWAEWCGPCKQIAPHLEALATELGDQVQVVKVNIDENPMTPTRYGVRGIPTLMLFKDGQIASTRVGTMPKTKLVEWVRDSI